MTFTVEIQNYGISDQCEVELYLDESALKDLCEQLSFLQSKGDHAHSMTASWGGNALTENKPVPDNQLANHLRVTLV